jgi:hypothetical protein
MYSPKIETKLVSKLFFLKVGYASLGIKKPMTDIVREALIAYISKAESEILSAGGTIPCPETKEAKK